MRHRQAGVVWECGTCGTFSKTPRAAPPGHELVWPKCTHNYPGYEMLPTFRVLPLPGETLAEYHQRVYGRPYPHEGRWPGTMLVIEADAA